MAQALKPIVLYGHQGAGPNPWKVVILLQELDIPYDHKLLQFPEMKQPNFEKVNPNGRVPAIEDPNTGITLWESGAILEYLIETYDKDRQFSFAAGTPEYFQTKQWLHYQMSGQGPYFGQAAWFLKFHSEQIPSAQERYKKEIHRVTGVLDKSLAGKQYLVGDKYTYADLAFVPWHLLASTFLGVVKEGEFPNVDAWFKRMTSRPAVQKALAEKEKAAGH